MSTDDLTSIAGFFIIASAIMALEHTNIAPRGSCRRQASELAIDDERLYDERLWTGLGVIAVELGYETALETARKIFHKSPPSPARSPAPRSHSSTKSSANNVSEITSEGGGEDPAP